MPFREADYEKLEQEPLAPFEASWKTILARQIGPTCQALRELFNGDGTWAQFEFKETAAIGRRRLGVQRKCCPQSECKPFNATSCLPRHPVFWRSSGPRRVMALRSRWEGLGRRAPLVFRSAVAAYQRSRFPPPPRPPNPPPPPPERCSIGFASLTVNVRPPMSVP